MSKVIGLTGGIGAGKSYIASLFVQKGIPVYDSDSEAKKLMHQPEVMQQLQQIFGNEVVQNNSVNRKKLAALVFNQPEKLKMLNQLIHPLVKQHFDHWKSKQTTPFVLKESAILFESGAYASCDFIITVEAPQEIRIQRVVQRDGVTPTEVLARIQNQWTSEQRTSKSHFVIDNTEKQNAQEEVNQIWEQLLKC